MLSSTAALLLLPYIALSVNARGLYSEKGLVAKRELPQEHSHEATIRSVRDSLNLDNPDEFQDPVFALLGDATAVQGDSPTNPVGGECMQLAIADRALTNALDSNNVTAATDAMIYRALERNSATVGATSNACTSFTPVNAALSNFDQHQDPASDGAAAVNKASTLGLAKEIANVGGDPQQALQAGTFAPGDLDDNTGAGNTCDDENDAEGCIFSQNLIVEDATAEEIEEAVAGDGAAAAASGQAQTAVAAASQALGTSSAGGGGVVARCLR